MGKSTERQSERATIERLEAEIIALRGELAAATRDGQRMRLDIVPLDGSRRYVDNRIDAVLGEQAARKFRAIMEHLQAAAVMVPDIYHPSRTVPLRSKREALEWILGQIDLIGSEKRDRETGEQVSGAERHETGDAIMTGDGAPTRPTL